MVAQILINFIMSSHTYMVGDRIYLQLVGGPIGLYITRVLARIVMIMFDRRFKTSLSLLTNSKRLLLDLRYVDDKNIIIDIIREEVSQREKEEKMAVNLKTEADKIFPGMIEVTVDMPSNYSDNKLPILDLKVWPGWVRKVIFYMSTIEKMFHIEV